MQTTTAKHTPGPWIFCGTHVDDSRGLPLVRSAHRDFDKINCADFHLIAAAPELLEALEGLLSVYVELVAPTDVFGEAANAEHIARAAIAKARGE